MTKKVTKTSLIFFLFPLICLSQQKEKWATSPKDQWPPIALTNNVLFKNADSYIHSSFAYAGTGFLIDTGTDTLAATAKHVLWIAKNKKTTAVQINQELQQWIMKPKGSTTDSAVIDKLINEDSTEILEGQASTVVERDWLIFSVKNVVGNIFPLKLRYSALVPGEKVYIPGCAYNDSICMVYEGKVLRKEGMDILIERNMKEHMGGSSGSPIIDGNGYLIGILSSGALDNKTGKNVTVAVSTEYLYNVLHIKPGLNAPKKDYGELILKTALEKGTKQAISQYIALSNDPGNYYIYNLRSANKNGLRETGEKLIEMGKLKDAIEILEFNAEINGGFYVNYNILAKAYLLAGNKKEAIKNYQISVTKFNDKEENEAFKELDKLKANR
jgi:hypothetical protein